MKGSLPVVKMSLLFFFFIGLNWLKSSIKLVLRLSGQINCK